MQETNLLLEVWREACRHIELEESIERIARLVASRIAADHLVIRQVDLVHGRLDTVAVAKCRLDVPAIGATRTADGATLLADAGGRAAVSANGGRTFAKVMLTPSMPLTGITDIGGGKLALVGPRGVAVSAMTSR